MFHLKYPRFRGFFTWDELGCMARALGFSVDLFKNHLIDEIQAEDNGLPLKEVTKMLDFKLLYKALHLSQNLHTDDWNTCVFRSCISILDRKALTFEDIYQARIAYQAYEDGDMKGMLIDQHVLLRSLKMCGKTISPMKLMHRVKHSSVKYDEPGRIQLYEFLDLLLWANGYEPYVPEKSFGHFEMEDSLFKLHDFNTLLTHHDEKLATKLDSQYLQEEWAFTKTKYASKSKLTDPAVISANRRMDMVNTQKNEFRKLKQEVGTSQTVVYKAAQGYIRNRPVTAPNFTMYDTRHIQEAQRRESRAIQHALNEKVQRLIKRTENKDINNNKILLDFSDKPAVSDYKRCQTPKVVTAEDKEETEKRLERLKFEIETEEGRYEIAMDSEMERYIPGYKDIYIKNKSKGQSAPHVTHKVKVKPPPQERYDMSKMSHPIPKISPSHAQKCDARQNMSRLQHVKLTESQVLAQVSLHGVCTLTWANTFYRFRGWYGVRSKKGPHYILMSPCFHNSHRGQLLKNMMKISDSSVKKLHGDFIYRYTKKGQVDRRPVTAPAVMTADEYAMKRGRHSKISQKTSPTPGYSSTDLLNHMSDIDEPLTVDDDSVSHHPDVVDLTSGNREPLNESVGSSKGNLSVHSNESKGEVDLDVSRDTVETTLSDKVKLMKLIDSNDKVISKPRAKSAQKQAVDNSLAQEIQPRSVSADGDRKCLDELVPMPYMDHSRPKVVSVGSIGKISLLESISEAKYWEDVMKEQERGKRVGVKVKNTQDRDAGNDGKPSIRDKNSSQNKGTNDDNIQVNVDRGESEILSIILKEDDLDREFPRTGSAFSDSHTPQGDKCNAGIQDVPDKIYLSGLNATTSGTVRDKKEKTYSKKKQKQKAFSKKETKIDVQKTPEPPNVDSTYMTENEKYLRKLYETFKAKSEKDDRHKRQASGRSGSSRSGSDSLKYDRLVNRVRDDISPRLAKRILSGP